MIELAAARFLHLAALVVLFGSALFPWYAKSCVAAAYSGRAIHRIEAGAAAVALLSGIAWFALTVAAITGSPTDLIPGESWRLVFAATNFGPLWLARSLVLCVLLFLALGQPGPLRSGAILAGAGLVLAATSGTGHTQVGPYRALHVTADAAHLLAAGAWVGGLIPLLYGLAGNADYRPRLLACFSRMGLTAVSVILGTGIVNATLILGSVAHLTDSDYGRMLLVKISLFAAMLLCAAANRFLFMPRLPESSQHLQRSVLIELGFGVIVIGMVAVLGLLEPGYQ
jgi:putative copper resistance protein D